MELTRNTLLKASAAVVGALVLLALVVGVLFATGVLAPPVVEDVESSWGAVTENTSAVRTEVTLRNPNPVGMPSVASVRYEVRLNDVTVASGRKGGIGLGTGTGTVVVRSRMNNSRVADWWATHVNRGERTDVRVRARVSALGISRSVPVQDQTLRTDVLAAMTNGSARTIRVRGDPFLVVADRNATWGEANASRVPLTFTARVENVHDHAVELDAVGYEVVMNDVTLGAGTVDGFAVAPGETKTVDVAATLRTRRFADWWPNHVRDGEESIMHVETYGVVERDGEPVRVPLSFVEQRLRLETALLDDGGETGIEPLPVQTERPGLEPVDLRGTTQEWGRVTDETTEVETTAALSNPNDGDLADLLTLSVHETTTINGVEVTNGSTTVTDVPTGNGSVAFTSDFDNDEVPVWWAEHLNSAAGDSGSDYEGETSTVRTRTSALADVGFTAFDVAVPDRENTVETHLLAGMNSDEDRAARSEGETIFTVTRTRASWGRATPEAAPLDTATTMRNEQFVPVTVESVDYEVSVNGIVLASGTKEKDLTISPGATRTMDLDMVLDNGKMDEWWVTPVRNDERSVMTVNATATVSVAGETRTVPLDVFGGGKTIETDLLGQDDAN